jgi:uncharacterized protein YjbI with pentapeptide repeats
MPDDVPAEEGLMLVAPPLTHETETARVPDDLLRHIEYQRWLFEDKAVLDEPFSLARTYVDTDCGALRWHDIHQARLEERDATADPIHEEDGQSLLEAALALIMDPSFRDAVVIQGPAGAGKTTFTLRLARELVDRGLHPVRIALGDLDLGAAAGIEQALALAVRIDGADRNPNVQRQWCDADLFVDRDSDRDSDSAVFNQVTWVEGVAMCPYVLILDGWDEIGVGTTGGFQQQMNRLLQALRATYLGRRSAPVRVVLTGKRLDAVEWSGFLRPETAVLSMRALTPTQLDDYLDSIYTAVTDEPDDAPAHWSRLETEVDIPALLERYEKDYEQALEKADRGELGHGWHGSVEVLGRPLLAYLALRLMAQWRGEFGPMLYDATTMYRSLFDMALGAPDEPDEPGEPGEPERAALAWKEARRDLRAIAMAMTVAGKERLSYEDFRERLGVQPGEPRDHDHAAPSRLMGRLILKIEARDSGGEFTHTSLREYLFAEYVVELLKEYGRRTRAPLPERPPGAYWTDFDPDDPRRELCRALCHLLGPQWMSVGTATYVSGLIDWEIGRARLPHMYPALEGQTEPLDMPAWIRIRDGLADVWDWWTEGVHLRPRLPQRTGPDQIDSPLGAPPVTEVIEGMMRRPLDPTSFRTVRVVTVDAHLGDALCRLTALVHGEIARRQGFFEEAARRDKYDQTEGGEGARRYQRCVTLGEQRWMLFDPAGADRKFLDTYCARINAAAYRPAGQFPASVPLFGAFLAGAEFFGMNLCRADLRGAFLRGVQLRHVDMRGADLRHANLRGAFLRHVDLRGAKLSGADLRHANLGGASLVSVDLRDADLRNADLRGAKLSGASLPRAKLNHANLRGTNLSGTDLRHANLGGADLGRANLARTNLSRANLRGANVSQQQLEFANVEGAAGLDQIIQIVQR